MVISLRVVEEIPSSSRPILIVLTATIAPVIIIFALYTHPQAPYPNLQIISKSFPGFVIEISTKILQKIDQTQSLQTQIFLGVSIFEIVQFKTSDLKLMKDRWKILIVAVIISLVLALLFIFLGFSFSTISLREYGLLQYDFFQTVDRSQTVRSNGNYLIGIDYSFVKYPRGLLHHNFNVQILTKDKSIVNIQGFFVGQLIQSQIVNLHFAYGPYDFLPIITKTAQEIFRQSIQQFLLTQIISQRQAINSYVSSNVCLGLQSKYSFINCQYVSTGELKVNAIPALLPPDTSIQSYFKKVLNSTIASQKKLNVYGNGGFNVMDDVQTLNAKLFRNTTSLIVSTVSTYTVEQAQIFAGATYILDNPLMPVLSNQIRFNSAT